MRKIFKYIGIGTVLTIIGLILGILYNHTSSKRLEIIDSKISRIDSIFIEVKNPNLDIDLISQKYNSLKSTLTKEDLENDAIKSKTNLIEQKIRWRIENPTSKIIGMDSIPDLNSIIDSSRKNVWRIQGELNED